MPSRSVDELEIVVLVDKVAREPALTTGYGLSIYLEPRVGGKNYHILFDTGPSYEILHRNAELLGVDLGKIDRIVISHFHRDHYGALPELLEHTPRQGTVFVPEEPWFAMHVLKKARRLGWRVARVQTSTPVAPGVYAFGPVARSLEISLKIVLRNGRQALIVGCGHASIPIILRWAGGKGEYELVAGGFHLKEEDEDSAEKLGEILSTINVVKVMPLHCSGHEDTFRKVLGEKFVEGGAGAKLTLL